MEQREGKTAVDIGGTAQLVGVEVTEIPGEGWRVAVSGLAEDDPQALRGFIGRCGEFFEVLDLDHPLERSYHASLADALTQLHIGAKPAGFEMRGAR